MAVGDSVSVYFHTATTFQPAAGVEIMVLTTFVTDGAQYMGFSDGTGSNTVRNYYNQSVNTGRFVITNTDYFYSLNAANYIGFNGMQIK